MEDGTTIEVQSRSGVIDFTPSAMSIEIDKGTHSLYRPQCQIETEVDVEVYHIGSGTQAYRRETRELSKQQSLRVTVPMPTPALMEAMRCAFDRQHPVQARAFQEGESQVFTGRVRSLVSNPDTLDFELWRVYTPIRTTITPMTPLTPSQTRQLQEMGLTVLPLGTPPTIDGYRIAWSHHEQRWECGVAHIDAMLRRVQ
jgi:hypothetical protein